jgi:uncharacterized protein
MKYLLLFAIGIAGLVASVFALHGGGAQAEKRLEYYANGQVQVECELREGVREGECHRFWPNGKPLAEGAYTNGLMSGTWTFWNEDGSEDAARSGAYVRGEHVGS